MTIIALSSEKTMCLIFYSIVIALLSVVSCQVLPQFEHGRLSLSNNSFIFYRDIGSRDFALKCVTDNVDCCNDTSVGNWRDVRGSPVQEGPLVCMSLEEMERSVSTERHSALTTHQDCGDVIFLTPVETCRTSTSTSAMMKHLV